MNVSEKRRVDFRIDRKLHADAQYVANLTGKTLTQFFIEAIKEKLEKEGKSK